jgi:hypothetical protein
MMGCDVDGKGLGWDVDVEGIGWDEVGWDGMG